MKSSKGAREGPTHDTPRAVLPPSAVGNPWQVDVALIAAVAANGVIGRDNRLPWRLPADLERFRSLTTGHAVIMGRLTWNSIGRPLPRRQNIVVSRDPAFRAEGAETAGSLAAALTRVTMASPAFVIGGSSLYAEALPLATRIHLTEIPADFEGDRRFPDFDRAQWREASREVREADGPDGLALSFVTLVRAIVPTPG